MLREAGRNVDVVSFIIPEGIEVVLVLFVFRPDKFE